MALLSLEEARSRILAAVSPAPTTETIPLDASLGRVLAAPVYARRDVPPFDNSAMDGFALRAGDLPGPVTVVQRIPAGQPAQPLAPGTAARIFTGAVLPEGADTVLIQENARLDGEQLSTEHPLSTGANIRRRGGDIARGALVLPQGRLMTPQDLGLIASAGFSEVSVYRPLQIAVITTGDELVEPGGTPEPWQIFNSNGVQLCAQISALGLVPKRYPNVPDDPELTGQALEAAARECDCIITSGGVSVGEEDHVRGQIEARGELTVWKLALKPGKPLAFGHVAGCPVFGLPGNPVSSWVTFGLLVKPWLASSQGARVKPQQRIEALAGFTVSRAGSREEYLRVVLDGGSPPTASLTGDQSSGVLSGAGAADALAVVPAGKTIAEGDRLEVMTIGEFLSPLAAG